MGTVKQMLAGWGNYPIVSSEVSRPDRHHTIDFYDEQVIARGLGRSYGDAAINSDRQVVLMERLDRFLSFDDQRGILRVEGGVTLEEILDVFVPKGWFLPVTPGTKYVTIGGSVACDVHGKNHHCDGTIGAHTVEVELLLADGGRCRCSPIKEPDLFWATVGGMGLTGIITEVAIKLIPIESAYMMVQHQIASNLDSVLALLDKSEGEDKYSVAWIDCLATGASLGRSVVMTGRHAAASELSVDQAMPLKVKKRGVWSVPFQFPSWFLNPVTIKTFNSVYYYLQSSKKEPFIIDYDRYFYPLDAVGSWNRMYGKRGFVQYQFVIPSKCAREGLQVLLQELSRSRRGSFLAVLKRFGKEGQGYLSFPTDGYTLALDIPVANEGLFSFLNHLDEIVLRMGGRLYLAKDARMKPKTFRAMYPRFQQWQNVKRRVDPDNRMSSDLSRRLKLGGVR